jgi:hypothetical protein
VGEENDAPRGFATDCWIETAEGPVIMHETPGKGFAAMTRFPDGHLGFRQLMKVVKSGPVPLVRVLLDSGHGFVVARRHPVFRRGMDPVPAEDLRPGDLLETAFHYPAVYLPDAPGQPAANAVAVRAVEPAGEGEVMTGTIRDTHALFVTAGVLCGE